MNPLQIIQTPEFEIVSASRFIETGYNYLSALKKSGGIETDEVKSRRAKFSAGVAMDMGKQGVTSDDVPALESDLLAKVAKSYGFEAPEDPPLPKKRPRPAAKVRTSWQCSPVSSLSDQEEPPE